MAISNGLYEIRSLLLTSMCVDVRGASAVKGANVQLYSSNDTNAQKYYVTLESSAHWSLQNAASGLYVDVNGGAARNGANVQQYTDNDSRAQRWKLTETGETVTVNGVTCTVVTIGSYVTNDGATYMMDVNGAMTTNSTNVQIYTSNGTDAQKFALLPTTLIDTTMPVPSLIGWAGVVGAADAQAVQPKAATLYPCWYITDAWNGVTGHGFEISYRSRLLGNGTATEGDWSAYTAWASAPVTLYGQTAWLTAGIPATFDTDNYKALEYSFRVRATGTVNGNAVHSSASVMSLRAVVAPTVAATAAKLGSDSVTITFTTDYDGGATVVNVAGIGDYLGEPITAYGYAPSFDIEIPFERFSAIPELGTVDVSCNVGTDQYAATGAVTSSVTLSEASSKTITVSPTLAFNADGTATITVNTGSVRRAWVSMGGDVIPLYQQSATKFTLPYPFGVSCEWFVGVENAAGTAWGYARGTVTANDSRKIRPCHAWNWDGGYFLLEVTDGLMQTDRSISANFTEYQLNNRPWASLKFSDTLGGSFSAEGVLKAGLTQSDKAALMELMKAHVVTYRAPTGEVASVGITDVQYTTLNGRTSVKVNMQQVA